MTELTNKEKLEKILNRWIDSWAGYQWAKVKWYYFVAWAAVNLNPEDDDNESIDCFHISFNDILLDSNIFEVLFPVKYCKTCKSYFEWDDANQTHCWPYGDPDMCQGTELTTLDRSSISQRWKVLLAEDRIWTLYSLMQETE